MVAKVASSSTAASSSDDALSTPAGVRPNKFVERGFRGSLTTVVEDNVRGEGLDNAAVSVENKVIPALKDGTAVGDCGGCLGPENALSNGLLFPRA